MIAICASREQIAHTRAVGGFEAGAGRAAGEDRWRGALVVAGSGQAGRSVGQGLRWEEDGARGPPDGAHRVF